MTIPSPDPGGNREMKDDEWDANTGKVPVWPAALRAMITKWLVMSDSDDERDWVEDFFPTGVGQGWGEGSDGEGLGRVGEGLGKGRPCW